MNRLLKKTLILITILVMMFTFTLVGCGKENANNAQIDENQNVHVEPDVSAADVDSEKIIEYGDFKGYLWEIKNKDATVYLFGSVHIANDEIYPFHEIVEKAYEISDILVVEADISDMSGIQEMAKMMIYEGDDDVYNHLSEEGIEKFEMISDELGVSKEFYKKFKIWALGSNLMSLQLLKAGYTGTEGIDMHFLEKAKNDKEIQELESIRFQLDLFNNLSDEQQEKLFLSELGTIKESIEGFEELYDNFKTEDVKLMTEYLIESSADEESYDEEIEKIILHDRNIGMADKIDGYLNTGKTYFVVAGLAHYLGDKSVIKLLEDRGYEVNQK